MNWYNKHIASKSGSRILYHIGRGYPQPVPYKSPLPFKEDWQRDHWGRYWKSFSKDEKVVFLTSDFVRVHTNHGLDGNLYIFEVPEWVIKEAGGIHIYDNAPEVIIPEHLWKYVVFKGKKNEEELEEICKKKSRRIPYGDFLEPTKRDYSVKVGDYVVWINSSKNGMGKESIFQVISIIGKEARLQYAGSFRHNIRGILYFIKAKFEGQYTALLSHLSKVTDKQKTAIDESLA